MDEGPRRMGPPRVGGPKVGATKGGATKSGAPKGGAPKGGGPKGGGPKISRFFPLPLIFVLFLSLGVFLVEFWWCVLKVLLFKPPRGGKVSKNALLDRFTKFAQGQWLHLLTQSVAASAAAIEMRKQEEKDRDGFRGETGRTCRGIDLFG